MEPDFILKDLVRLTEEHPNPNPKWSHSPFIVDSWAIVNEIGDEFCMIRFEGERESQPAPTAHLRRALDGEDLAKYRADEEWRETDG
jgi:hypothetical protein